MPYRAKRTTLVSEHETHSKDGERGVSVEAMHEATHRRPSASLAPHRAALLIQALSSPAAAAVIGALPSRPGQSAPVAALVAQASDPQRWHGEAARLAAVGAVRLDQSDGQTSIALDRDTIAAVLDGLCHDLPGEQLARRHPELRPFIAYGRFTSWPAQPAKVEQVHAALAELFAPGEQLDEAGVNERLAEVLEDVAQVRRGLVDRGILRREPGSDRYRVPTQP